MAHTYKFKGQSVQKIKWEQTDGQTDRRRRLLYTFPSKAVVIERYTMKYRIIRDEVCRVDRLLYALYGLGVCLRNNYPHVSEGICFTGVGLCVCLSVTTITKKIVDGFVPNFMGRLLGGKGRPSSCFVTIGRGMWK